MKKFVPALSVIALLSLPVTALATPAPIVTAPSQCAGMTFDTMLTAGSAQVVTGTAGRDLIIAGDADIVNGLGGNDCIVAGAGDIVHAGDGNDVVVLPNAGDKAYGGNGNDKLYDLAGNNKLLGEDGNDYLSTVGNGAVDGGNGTDECYTGKNGKITNCELPVPVLVVKALRVLGL